MDSLQYERLPPKFVLQYERLPPKFVTRKTIQGR